MGGVGGTQDGEHGGLERSLQPLVSPGQPCKHILKLTQWMDLHTHRHTPEAATLTQATDFLKGVSYLVPPLDNMAALTVHPRARNMAPLGRRGVVWCCVV